MPVFRELRSAREAGFDNLNLDIMFGLPAQTRAGAKDDLVEALALRPEHISYYRLTLEPNTLFHRHPPQLPDEDLAAEIQDQGERLLAEHGYRRYEVSAYARPGRHCVHNHHYWQFGDYLGIGPGAHGKLTLADGRVHRRWKRRQPAAYLEGLGSGRFLGGSRGLDADDLRIEFLMNALRLANGFSPPLFERRTGLPFASLDPGLRRAGELGLVTRTPDSVRPTRRGLDFLNDLLALFAGTATHP